MMRLHSPSSSFVSANSIRVLSNSWRKSSNCSFNSSFSSLHTTLMHLRGLCCLGCFPPKCGCAGTVLRSGTAFSVRFSGSGQLPKICVITSSSCCEEIFNSLSFCAVKALCFFAFSFPPELWDVFLAFFPAWGKTKTSDGQLLVKFNSQWQKEMWDKQHNWHNLSYRMKAFKKGKN